MALLDTTIKYLGNEVTSLLWFTRPRVWKEHTYSWHAVDSPPSKVVPSDCPRQNNRSPQTKFCSHTWSPLAANCPPSADCGLFAIAFAIALAYEEQPGHCLFDQNKMRQHLLKSLQEGEMTPLPLKKNGRNGCSENLEYDTGSLYL